MTDDEQALLDEIRRSGPIGARVLAKRLKWPQSTLFRTLTALEDQGLVAPVGNGDDPLRRKVAATTRA